MGGEGAPSHVNCRWIDDGSDSRVQTQLAGASEGGGGFLIGTRNRFLRDCTQREAQQPSIILRGTQRGDLLIIGPVKKNCSLIDFIVFGSSQASVEQREGWGAGGGGGPDSCIGFD